MSISCDPEGNITLDVIVSEVNLNSNKLLGIADGAEVNVQVDWTEVATDSDAFILNKPVINEAAEQNVQVDWSETVTDSDAFILNKPTIEPNVQSNWDEIDTENDAFIQNKPTVNEAAEENVQADWDETDVGSDAFIVNKPTTVSSDTKLAADGNSIVKADDSAIQNQCSAWVYFAPDDGLGGDQEILDGFNVALVESGTIAGNYTVTFSEPMDNIYYVVAGSGMLCSVSPTLTGKTVNKVDIAVAFVVDGSPVDDTHVSVIVFGGKTLPVKAD